MWSIFQDRNIVHTVQWTVPVNIKGYIRVYFYPQGRIFSIINIYTYIIFILSLQFFYYLFQPTLCYMASWFPTGLFVSRPLSAVVIPTRMLYISDFKPVFYTLPVLAATQQDKLDGQFYSLCPDKNLFNNVQYCTKVCKYVANSPVLYRYTVVDGLAV